VRVGDGDGELTSPLVGIRGSEECVDALCAASRRVECEEWALEITTNHQLLTTNQCTDVLWHVWYNHQPTTNY